MCAQVCKQNDQTTHAYLHSSSKLLLYTHHISSNPSCYLQPLLLGPVYVFILIEKNTELIIANCFFMARLSPTQSNFISPSSITAEEGGVWLRHLIYHH